MITEEGKSKEVILTGIAASPGIAIGSAYLYSKVVPKVSPRSLADNEVDAELQRLQDALARSEKELQKIHSFAEQKLGAQSARIFEAQIMILQDSVLMGAIRNRIRNEKKNAEYLVFDEVDKYRRIMSDSADEYIQERAHDVDDVMNRIIRNILDRKLFSRLEGESLIVSESLTPADTVIFSRNQILGYATDFGGFTSHAALLSRSLKIPAVLGLRTATKHIKTGDCIALDGYGGALIIHPSDETIESLRRKEQRLKEFDKKLEGIANLPAETLDHKRYELSANLELQDEVEYAIQQGSQGIGLYRTEGQLMGRQSFPSEDEQAAEYTAIAEQMFPHPVMLRTFDIGGDKMSPVPLKEENPFLGWRGIRVSLDRPEMFLDQLRAILRASAKKNVRMLLPMVSKIGEVRKAKEFLKQAQHDLTLRRCPFDKNMRLGVMIEVPSAAVLAEELAREADFLSIGTNDLIQYLLAVDRGNSMVASLYQEFNPAVIRTVKSIIDAGHKHGKWVGMCGEMAGNPIATILLVGLGLDEFSVAPPILPEIKKIIRSIKFKDARKIADKVLTLPTEYEIKEYLAAIVKEKLPDMPVEALDTSQDKLYVPSPKPL
ncbi:MAG: phosphoenolpyruvate--protein phosphotransferase [Bacteroidetes bacterium]|nr:phosphoenolpyruvate--protein phosphotransferase [Bacteroidota bacterium]MCW5896635.1 phosphoenolpyruvate--protein phosphotransferase [Bacteroidota bacterium]